ncbi:MAG: lactonase family protein, partial [Bdellovibrionales bacterium]|nr:lactonase family protein [Bdellovibrionales bacterium]
MGNQKTSRLFKNSLTLVLLGVLSGCGILSEKFLQTSTSETIAVEFSSKPSDPTTETTANFSFVSSGATSLTCQINSDAETPCTSGVSYSALTPGTKRLVVRRGGVEIKSYSWTVLPPPVYLFTIGNSDPGYMHVFEQNTSTGDLSFKSKLALGSWSNWGAISPNKKWGYSVEMGPNTVTAVNLTNPSAISLINTTTLATQPRAMAAHPTLNRLYVGDNLTSGSIYTLTIDPTTGATQQLGSAIAAGAKPRALRISPNGKILYVANWWDWTVSIYTIDQTTGALTAAGTQATCGDPVALDMSANGGFLFVGCSSSNDIGVYSTNP